MAKKKVSTTERRKRVIKRAKTTARTSRKKTTKKKARTRPAPEITIHSGPEEDNGQRLVSASWDGGQHQQEFNVADVAARESFIGEVARQADCDPGRLCALHEGVENAAASADEIVEDAFDDDEGGNRPMGGAASLLPNDDEVEYFKTPDGEAYISFTVSTHRENWPVGSKTVYKMLMKRAYDDSRTVPSQQGLQDAVRLMEAKACFDGPELPVFLRVAEHEGNIYIDLCNSEWEAVRISPEAVRLVRNPPVKFRRSPGMQPLPRPRRGGSVEELRPFINAEDDDAFILSVGWLLGALSHSGPYPLDVAFGEQGSAKSTRTKVLRGLIDPQRAAMRSEPRSTRDLMVAAQNSFVLAFDNLSFVKNELSDALCRLSTGGGYGTRRLYTDDEEQIFDFQRPIMLNGIEELATRGDLLDRAIVQQLPVIPHCRRVSEHDFWLRFEAARPRILGALYEAVSSALRNLSTTEVEDPPRMADFALWVTAAEGALGWEDGRFVRAYRRNIQNTKIVALETSPVYEPLCRHMAERRKCGELQWTGTATQLLKKLEGYAEKTTDRSGWPRNAQSLSGKLRRLAPNLRAIGMEVEFRKHSGRKRTRLIQIRAADNTQPTGES